MLKKYLIYFMCFIALFYLNFNFISAYEYIDPNNEDSVMDKFNEIYDAKEQYEDLVGDYEETEIINVSNSAYWWPVGSEETTEKNGKLFAIGTPISVNVTSGFGGRLDPFGTNANVNHFGIDIGNAGHGAGEVNIIAARSGEVIYPLDSSQTSYNDNGTRTDGGGFGNHVKIKHSDGSITLYAHMAKDSITVKAGDVVEQGQVIGKMGHSGDSTAVHLHFEIRLGADSSKSSVNPLDYVDPSNPRPTSSGGGSDFSLVSTILSKEEFVAKMNDYCTRSGKKGFCNNFAKNAEEIYDVSIDSGVNPELVVVTAGAEQNWTLSSACSYTNNYWGIGIGNGKGCNSGGKYKSLAEGIVAYSQVLSDYNVGGKREQTITNRYNERESAGCNASGHGLPGTLSGMQSLYSWIGNYRFNPGNYGLGGCVYLNIMYGDNYCSTKPTCTDYNNCPAGSETTVCEQNDYTAWQIDKKLQIRYDIFGL